MDKNYESVPVVILSGGAGIYIDSTGVRKAKANVLVNNKPLIYYVLQSYLKHGFRTFYVSGSYQLAETEQLLKSAFGQVFKYDNEVFNITFSDSGRDTKTGSRVKFFSKELQKNENFAVTYSDSVTTHSLSDQFEFHKSNGYEGTLIATRLPTRFRTLGIRPGENIIRGFSEKPLFKGDYINGGFYFFKSSVLKNPIFSKEEITLETDLLDSLVDRQQLGSYVYEGSWHHLDCERDVKSLSTICAD